jgi:hypothetical protein
VTVEELGWPSRAAAVAAESASSGSKQNAADLTELFRQHHLELVRLAALLVRSREAAEDIVQDVFVRDSRQACGRTGHSGRAGLPAPGRDQRLPLLAAPPVGGPKARASGPDRSRRA